MTFYFESKLRNAVQNEEVSRVEAQRSPQNSGGQPRVNRIVQHKNPCSDTPSADYIANKFQKDGAMWRKSKNEAASETHHVLCKSRAVSQLLLVRDKLVWKVSEVTGEEVHSWNTQKSAVEYKASVMFSQIKLWNNEWPLPESQAGVNSRTARVTGLCCSPFQKGRFPFLWPVPSYKFPLTERTVVSVFFISISELIYFLCKCLSRFCRTVWLHYVFFLFSHKVGRLHRKKNM